jgi:hypothetical protein
MKLVSTLTLLALLPTAHGASLTQSDPAEGGIEYYWTATFGGADAATTPNIAGANVGAWSWEDQGLFEPGSPTRGWTHTSQWAAIELSQASTFTLMLAANSLIPTATGFRPADQFFPSFSLYSGWDNDAMPDAIAAAIGEELGAGNSHTYNNRGDIDWAEDLTFIGMMENTTLDTVSATWVLPAGKYSIAMGSNAPSTLSPPRQGYAATFTTAPIPEPSGLLLAATSLGGLILRRKRTASH